MRKGKDPDPGGPKTCGSRSPTLKLCIAEVKSYVSASYNPLLIYCDEKENKDFDLNWFVRPFELRGESRPILSLWTGGLAIFVLDLTQPFLWQSRNMCRLPLLSVRLLRFTIFRSLERRHKGMRKSVLFYRIRIHNILIRIQILIIGSVHWITDPDRDPALLVNGFQDASKKIFLFL